MTGKGVAESSGTGDIQLGQVTAIQRSEFLLEKGFIDLVVDRNNLQNKLDNILSLLK